MTPTSLSEKSHGDDAKKNCRFLIGQSATVPGGLPVPGTLDPYQSLEGATSVAVLLYLRHGTNEFDAPDVHVPRTVYVDGPG